MFLFSRPRAGSAALGFAAAAGAPRQPRPGLPPPAASSRVPVPAPRHLTGCACSCHSRHPFPVPGPAPGAAAQPGGAAGLAPCPHTACATPPGTERQPGGGPPRCPGPASRLSGRRAAESRCRGQQGLLLQQERPGRDSPAARPRHRLPPTAKMAAAPPQPAPVRLRPPRAGDPGVSRGWSSRSAPHAAGDGAELGPRRCPGRGSAVAAAAAAAGGDALRQCRPGGSAAWRDSPAADGGAAGHRYHGHRPPAGEGAAGGPGRVRGRLRRGRCRRLVRAPYVPSGFGSPSCVRSRCSLAFISLRAAPHSKHPTEMLAALALYFLTHCWKK